MAPTRKRPFHTASDAEIKTGEVSDVYFQRTVEILDRARRPQARQGRGLPQVAARGLALGRPRRHRGGGGLLDGRAGRRRGDGRGHRVRALPARSSRIEGIYVEWAQYETALLGLLCQASGIATKAARCKKAAGERQVISFGARRMHPTLAPMIERNAFIGGCDGVAVTKSAELIDADPMGTIPHSLVLMVGDTVEALKAFHEVVEPKVRRVALIDTLQDEKFEAMRVAEALGKDLYAVRLDTPSSRRGDLYRILEEVRWELNLRGFDHVKLVASGGVDEYEILHLNPVVDAYGVGTSIANAPVLNFALDIMEIEGKPMAKRGKWSGAKDVLRQRGTLRDRRRPGRQRPRRPAAPGIRCSSRWCTAAASCATCRRPARSATSSSISSRACRWRRCGGKGCAATSSGELMSSILERIVADKREEVAARKRAAPRAELERRCAGLPPPRDFEARAAPAPGRWR